MVSGACVFERFPSYPHSMRTCSEQRAPSSEAIAITTSLNLITPAIMVAITKSLNNASDYTFNRYCCADERSWHRSRKSPLCCFGASCCLHLTDAYCCLLLPVAACCCLLLLPAACFLLFAVQFVAAHCCLLRIAIAYSYAMPHSALDGCLLLFTFTYCCLLFLIAFSRCLLLLRCLLLPIAAYCCECLLSAASCCCTTVCCDMLPPYYIYCRICARGQAITISLSMTQEFARIASR